MLLDDVERHAADQTGRLDAGSRPSAPAVAGSRRRPAAHAAASQTLDAAIDDAGAAARPQAPARSGPATTEPGRVTRGEIAAWSAVAVLGLIGFYNSFFTLRDSAVGQTFGSRALTLPLIIDIGIAAFTALDLCLAARGDRVGWVRLFPWALNGVTVYLNVVEQPSAAGKVAHAAPPVLWIAAVEAAALLVKRRVEGPKVKPDRIPVALWFLAPGPTVLFWRRMRKQGITSYAQAWQKDKHRRLVRARFRREFGRWSWRWSAPEEQLELYRLGELVAVDVVTEVGASPMPARRAQPADADRDDPGIETGPRLETDAPSRKARDSSQARRPGRKPAGRASRNGQLSARATGLLPIAIEIAEQHHGRLNRDQLRDALAARGEGAGGSTLADLRAALRDGGHVQ